MIRRSVFVYFAAAALIFAGIIFPEFLGSTRADYNSVANYLSELGATGTSTQRLTNGLAFPTVGISCLLIIIALWHRLPATKTMRVGLICLGLGIPLGYFGAVAFPCDYGCPIEGSASQTAHNLLGLIQYPLGIAGFALLGVNFKSRLVLGVLCRFATAAMLIGFVMMIIPDQAEFRGAWQRFGDYSAFIALVGLVLSTQPRWAQRGSGA